MQLAGLGPDPTLLGFVLAGLEGMKQPQDLERLHGGEGSAWESYLMQLDFLEYLLVDLGPNLASSHPLRKECIRIAFAPREVTNSN